MRTLITSDGIYDPPYVYRRGVGVTLNQSASCQIIYWCNVFTGMKGGFSSVAQSNKTRRFFDVTLSAQSEHLFYPDLLCCHCHQWRPRHACWLVDGWIVDEWWLWQLPVAVKAAKMVTGDICNLPDTTEKGKNRNMIKHGCKRWGTEQHDTQGKNDSICILNKNIRKVQRAHKRESIARANHTKKQFD